MPHIERVILYPDRYPTREHYPFCLPLFQQTTEVDLSSSITIFVGENGTGKSTLLEAIARKCRLHIWENEEGLRVERNPYQHSLYQYIDVRWTDGEVPGSFFSSLIFRQFSIMLDEFAATDPGQLQYFGGKSLLTQSHGQSLMSFFRARYQRKGLFLLDEPESALSPKSQLALVSLIHEMAAAGHAQFLICTHSPILLVCPGARIYSFNQAPITSIRYEETDHYRIYKSFLSDPERYLVSSGDKG